MAAVRKGLPKSERVSELTEGFSGVAEGFSEVAESVSELAEGISEEKRVVFGGDLGFWGVVCVAYNNNGIAVNNLNVNFVTH